LLTAEVDNPKTLDAGQSFELLLLAQMPAYWTNSSSLINEKKGKRGEK